MLKGLKQFADTARKWSPNMKSLIFYYTMILFYVVQAAGQMIAGVRYYPASPWTCIIFNICVAALGLYGYRRNQRERWAAATSVFILPLAMLGLAAHFYSYPLWIVSFYIAFTGKGNKLIKCVVNSICVTLSALPILFMLAIAIISPMGFMLGMGGRTTVKERYSPDKRYIAVVRITEAVPAGGSTSVSVGRYLDLGIFGKYLPNRSLYEDNGTEFPDISFSEDGSRVLINGISNKLW